jgi:hypothetical protein
MLYFMGCASRVDTIKILLLVSCITKLLELKKCAFLACHKKTTWTRSLRRHLARENKGYICKGTVGLAITKLRSHSSRAGKTIRK